MSECLSLSKNSFFDRLSEFKKGGKTSKPSSSAYDGTVELGLRCKSKCLAQQAFEVLFAVSEIRSQSLI